MKIQASTVLLTGGYHHESSRTVKESVHYQIQGRSREALPSMNNPKDILDLTAHEPQQVTKEVAVELSAKDREIIDLIERFIFQLTGKKIKLVIPEKITVEQPQHSLQVRLENASQGWSFEYDYEETYAEKESMHFTAQGQITTEDGRKIDFQLQIGASREFFSKNSFSIRAGEALVDPLVINYDGKLPELTEIKFGFDLTSDTQEEMISFLKEGSGFLAYDKNGDGKINNGSELFGPSTGNGFSELARYDSDNNGWIDHNDPIFDKLRIWIKDSSGNDQLIALSEKGIGAIYLGNIDTHFSLKNNNNTMHGQIEKTGIFLKQNGQPGTVQHVNLVV